jgi:hypothetical protein
MVNEVPESKIKPVAVKKNYDLKTLKATVYNRVKDWTTDEKNDEEKQQKNRFVWNILL